jgi:hypothetical protein
MEVSEMVLFKSCPKCKGDMHIDRDIYGEYKECLNCGLMEDLPSKNTTLAATTIVLRKRRVA